MILKPIFIKITIKIHIEFPMKKIVQIQHFSYLNPTCGKHSTNIKRTPLFPPSQFSLKNIFCFDWILDEKFVQYRSTLVTLA